MSILVPVALSPCLPTELLTYILAQQSYPTTLLICSSRADFLSSLLQATTALPLLSTDLPTPHEAHIQPDANLTDAELEELENLPAEESRNLPAQHHLLNPTLQQVLSSRHTELAFLPTLSHLRAYLSVFPCPSKQTPVAKSGLDPNSKARDKGPPAPFPHFDKPGTSSKPLLVVYGLIKLHENTSEWSAQGLSNTVASLVEAGQRTGVRVVIVEERGSMRDAGVDGDGDVSVMEGGDAGDGGRSPGHRASDDVELWRQRVSMLNGSVRRLFGDGDGEGPAWSGRTVEVGSVIGRWFRFEEREW